jgi:uncharacterized membrane protein
MLLGTVGCGLTARALLNLKLRRLLGVGPSRRGIDLQGTINIDAPIEHVFDLFSRPENYSRLTDAVAWARNLGGGRCQKMIRLPGGTEVLLDERITTLEKNRMIRWRSEPTSLVRYAGTAWFNEVEEGRTQVQVCMTYNPPGGFLSHAASTLGGMSPKLLLDDFLMRAKSYLETGRQPRDPGDHERPTAEGAREGQKNQRNEEQALPDVVDRGRSIPSTGSSIQPSRPAVHDL